MSIQDAWNYLTGAVENIGSTIGEADLRSTNLFDYNIDDNTLDQSEYDFRYRTFPADLANDYVGHYVVININVPVFARSGEARTSYGGARFGQNILENEFSKVDTLRFGNAMNVGGTSPITGQPTLNAEPLSIPRYTRRIKESIAMFMPNPVIFNTTNEFQEISLTAMASGLLSGAGAIVGGFIGGARGGVEGAQGGSAAGGNLVSGAGNIIGQTSSILGYPINPRVEVLFSKTNLRQFVLEFLMAPRNEQESENMKAIIRTLRFHSAPELDTSTAGFTWIPPAEFDVTFFDKGRENTNIPRINTCVLDRIEVDYAPTGVYSTFSNGHPVAARLSLGMREVEVVHKRRVLQGF
jgi:hypothetical protein